MSFGKRRPKLSRAHLRPSNPIAHPARPPGPTAGSPGPPRRRRASPCSPPPPSFTARGPPSPSGSASGPSARSASMSTSSSDATRRRPTAERQIVGRPGSRPSMVNDPAPIRDLAERLDDLTVAIAKAPGSTRCPRTSARPGSSTPKPSTSSRRPPTRPSGATPCTGRSRQAFAPLIRDGVLGSDTLPASEESSRTLAVRAVGQTARAGAPGPPRAGRPRAGDHARGPGLPGVHRRLPQPELGPTLFRLVAEKLKGTPTLTYEEQYTNRRRELARSRVKDVYDTYRRGDVLVEQDQKIERGAVDPAPDGARRGQRRSRPGRPGPPGRLDGRPGRGAVRPDRLLRPAARAPDRRRPASDRRALRPGRPRRSAWSGCSPSSPGTPS